MTQQSQFDRYLIVSELGQGGMATVYRAYDPRFKREVALKALPAILLEEPGFRERFEREAQVVASLEHSAIVPVYDFGEANGRPYLVMRLMTGGSLADRLECGPLALDEIVRILQRLAPALDAAHKHGIIHRDLKPANILFDQYNDPHLADFGIVKLADRNITQALTVTGSTMGTPAYMSPEQVQGGTLDGRSDVYSLGVVLFEMLAGKRPYEATTPLALAFKHVLEPVPLLARSDLPVEYQAVVNKALAKSPEHRYSTASALAADVQVLASHPPLPTHSLHAEYPATEVMKPLFVQIPQVVSSTSILEDAKIATTPEVTYAISPPITKPGRGRKRLTWLFGIGSLIGVIFIIYMTITALNLTKPETDEPTAISLSASETSPSATSISTPTLIPLVPPQNAQLGDRWTRRADNMVMVFVPGDTFLMGIDPVQNPDVYSDKFPQHEVILSSFWIDRTEITNAMYGNCVADGDCIESSYAHDENFNGANYPVVGVSWNDAHAYCVWAGGQLPTEAQWEYAARGSATRLYPWGNETPTCNLAQSAECDGYTMLVSSFSPQGDAWVGTTDMAGNVWEWVADWYSSYPAVTSTNPMGPTDGDTKVLRGGSWHASSIALLVAYRYQASPNLRNDSFGIRCAVPAGS